MNKRSTPELDDWLSCADRSFSEVFDLYYKKLCFYAAAFVQDRPTAEDIVQDCFVKLWKMRSQLEVQEGLSAFLYAMVRNAVYDHFRSSYRRTHVSGLELVGDKAFQEEVVHAETIAGLVQLSHRLPQKTREVFRLLFIEGADHADTARILNISESTVRTQKARALTLLRRHMARLLNFFSFFF